MKNKFLIIWSVALATLFLACSKDDANPVINYPPKTDKCSECDALKHIILTDPLINDDYIDSLWCDVNNYCNINLKKEHENLYGIGYYIRSKQSLYSGWVKEYERVYADYTPNADTPYMGPVYFAFDYNYNTQNKLTQINGLFSDHLYYFDANYIMYEKGEPVVRPQIRPLDNFKYPNYRLVQKNDTFTYFHDRKKLYINNQIVIMPVYYTMVLDHEKDEMSLRAEFYKTSQDRQNKVPPVYVSTRYRLKRV